MMCFSRVTKYCEQNSIYSRHGEVSASAQATHSFTHPPVSRTWMRLDCGRKLEDLEKAHTDTRRTRKQQREMLEMSPEPSSHMALSAGLSLLSEYLRMLDPELGQERTFRMLSFTQNMLSI